MAPIASSEIHLKLYKPLQRKELEILGNFDCGLDFEKLEKKEVYKKEEVVRFRKTKDPYGQFSNFAGGFPVVIDGVFFRTTEHLYQSSKFSYHPDIQELIIQEPNPLIAKWIAGKYRQSIRADWEKIKIGVMFYCLNLKVKQNHEKLIPVLLSTESRPLVEESKRDAYWGAKSEGEFLAGCNVLGKLWMHIRSNLEVT